MELKFYFNLLNFQLSPSSNFLYSETANAPSLLNQNTDNQILTPDELIIKRSFILSSRNNSEIERDFRRICLMNDNCSISSPELSYAYKEYIKAYHQTTSIYFLRRISNRTELVIYDSESEVEEIKILETSEVLSAEMCISRLPNGELFCFGNGRNSRNTFRIDSDYRVSRLPSGARCSNSSAIYFNRNIYWFGGIDWNNWPLTLSRRFDLNQNRWKSLAPMPQADANCTSVIFYGNILISGFYNRNILIYSPDIDSFSIMNYELEVCQVKVLINAEERLYLIEFSNNLFIYESEVGDEYSLKLIVHSTHYHVPFRTYWTYNKGGIYIPISIYNGD
ncbi:unnamed protein product [Blepharisma stoltei]|uniref:Kelch motif family protein n=1 Tax=Blepharisma stoltei TaxID=1481888 RepID=A0AAU9IUC7_9CILI|nr:unnamed protein product [Blepharisma stoltei]